MPLCEAGPLPPLLRVWPLRVEVRPPLSLDQHLRQLLQLQILHSIPGLRIRLVLVRCAHRLAALRCLLDGERIRTYVHTVRNVGRR